MRLYYLRASRSKRVFWRPDCPGMIRIVLLTMVLGFVSALRAQDSDLLLNHDLYHLADRIDIRGLTGGAVHTELKPYGLESLRNIFRQADTSSLSRVERRWLQRALSLIDDSAATESIGQKAFPFIGRRDLIQLDRDKLRLFVNPVLHTGIGQELHGFGAAGPQAQFLSANGRGVVVRGTVAGRLGFYAQVHDNIMRLPEYIVRPYRTNANLFGETFIKAFGGKPNGVDFLHARGYITYKPFQSMRIKFGHDRAFWGNGYQSLMLSDYSANHLMLNIVTRIWKLEYVNHFAQMIDYIPFKPDAIGTHPRKYGVFHQLSWKPNARFSVGLFESVMYAPNLPNGSRGFELQYLNPIIFYRAVEQSIGSPDNSLLGAHYKWNVFKRVQLYGQILLDDFNIGQLQENNGWWGNKTGTQTGLKYIDVLGIRTLDLQAEWNRVRPYTYQHFNSSSNYTHYGQYLGHAEGANLNDLTMILRYHPLPALQIWFRASSLVKGLDRDGINYGGDVTVSSSVNRPGDFGNFVGQGQSWEVLSLHGRLSWQLFAGDNWIDLDARYRNEGGIVSRQLMLVLRSSLPQWEIKK